MLGRQKRIQSVDSSKERGRIRVRGSSAALRVLIVLAVIVCGLSVPPGVVLAKAPLGKQWPATQQISLIDIDHTSLSVCWERMSTMKAMLTTPAG